MPRDRTYRAFRISIRVNAAEKRMYLATCRRLGLDQAEFLRAGARLLVSKERRAAREEPDAEDAGVVLG